MKKMKKMMALALAMVMVLAMSLPVFAQTQAYSGTDGDGAKITVNNPAKGETYTVYKLFDATITSDGSGINYFYLDASGNRVTKASDLPVPPPCSSPSINIFAFLRKASPYRSVSMFS